MTEKKEKQPSKHWQIIEDLYYHFSLILNIDRHLKQQSAKKSRVFLQIAKWIGKDNIQCRTHHEKKIEKWKKRHGSRQASVLLLRKFYYQNYKIRILDEKHLKTELRKFLDHVKPTLSKENQEYEYNLYVQKIDSNVAFLKLNEVNSSEIDKAQEQEREDSKIMEQQNKQVKEYPKINLDRGPFSQPYALIGPEGDQSQYIYSEESDKFVHFSEDRSVYGQ